MGGLPGPSGGDSDPAEVHTNQTEADGPKVPEPGPVAGGDGEGGKHQTSSEVRQSHQGDSAEETPGQREPGFLLKSFQVHIRYALLIFCASVSGLKLKRKTTHYIINSNVL